MPYVSDEVYREKFESVQEFVERHGGHAASVVIGSWRLFSDGAQLASDLQVRLEPPQDRGALVLARTRYVKEKLRLEVADFERAHGEYANSISLASQYGNLPCAGAEHAACLEAGRDRISQLRADLEQLMTDPDSRNKKPAANNDRGTKISSGVRQIGIIFELI